jgi:hypothetical protein
MALFHPNLVSYPKYSNEPAKAKGGVEFNRFTSNAKDSVVDTAADAAAKMVKLPGRFRSLVPLALDVAPKLKKGTKSSSDELLGTLLATAPVPGLGAGYMAHQSAKKGPDDKYWGHFASGFVPGTAAGIGAGVAGGRLTNMLTNAIGKKVKLPSQVLKWSPLVGAALAGAIAEPMATNAGTRVYKYFNPD